MLKLLYLLPFPPRLDATHGGSRVMAHMLVRMSARHRVALLYLRSADDPPIDERLCEQCEILQEVRRPDLVMTPGARWHLRLRIGFAWMRGRPMLATVWRVAGCAEQLSKLLETWQPDLLQVEYHAMGQYLLALNGCSVPIVLTEYEPGIEAASDRLRYSRAIQSILLGVDRLVWGRFEPAVLRAVDAVVVFTERDREVIARVGGSTLIVRIPLQTTPPQHPLNPQGERPWRLVFVGNFIHPPNVDAALHLVQEIFPQVQSLHPETRLDIVGDQPPSQLRQATNQQVTVTGYVSDVTPYLDRAAVVVIPLRLGGGMRVKVLEALAAGKAVVASPLAIEGLELIDGEHVLIARNDAQFCEQIARLLADPERRAWLAANARAWACAHFNWEKTIAAYEALYADLLDMRSEHAHYAVG